MRQFAIPYNKLKMNVELEVTAGVKMNFDEVTKIISHAPFKPHPY